MASRRSENDSANWRALHRPDEALSLLLELPLGLSAGMPTFVAWVHGVSWQPQGRYVVSPLQQTVAS